jgi:hypothetical protein
MTLSRALYSSLRNVDQAEPSWTKRIYATPEQRRHIRFGRASWQCSLILSRQLYATGCTYQFDVPTLRKSG